MARSVPTRSLTKSVGVAAASAGAARRRPAAQPPVAATSAATRSRSNTYPVAASIAAASSPVNRSCSARTSTRLPSARSLPRWIGRVAPARQHHAHVRRPVAQERPQPVDGGRVGEVLRAVQHDRQRLGHGVQSVGDGREEVHVGGRVVRRHEVVQRVADGHHRAGAQRGEQDRPETPPAVVDGRQRRPHGVHGVGAQPVGEQRGLAPPGRGADQHDVAGLRLVEPVEQPPAGDVPGPEPRDRNPLPRTGADRRAAHRRPTTHAPWG